MSNEKKLIELAYGAANNAYAPYSGFCVGAALECEDGTVYTGHNIENASFGACMCAERVALYNAFGGKVKPIKRMAVVNSKGGLTPPCGLCRQVLSEFVDEDFEIIMEDEDGPVVKRFDEIMPYSFKLEVEHE
ncbi:MAG TPA: cytidine deaminase [Eubacterium sp.]|jgi:cytidine deaminase|nr:cytidine deaminase [Lachnospiraceae bacterium]HAZ91303.1 cytidine deaminase [Eubacterium sp.]HBZ53717.1 cytidine deaminase [Eubacterium sp.]